MFRNRRNSQKPNEDLYTTFKQNFPPVSASSNVAATGTSTAAGPIPAHTAHAIPDAMTDASLDDGPFGDHDNGKDHDLTPRSSLDLWRITPSILDNNTFSFGAFLNQAPGYYTPTPGGMNTVYHNPAAGDLHTPGFAFHLGTPLSMPLTESSLNAGTSYNVSGFNPHLFQNQPFQDHSPFSHQQEGYPPSMLVHQDSGYAAIDGSPDNELDMGSTAQRDSHMITPASLRTRKSMPAPPVPTDNGFRYRVTLNAPTAMIRQPSEIPITYLNKGQAYTIAIEDTKPTVPSPNPIKYRTVIRISFEDEQQRQRPSACWQLWKEGRGLAESHQRGGKLQAVEFVDPHPGAEEDPRRPRIELENTSFDCFSVVWTPSIATSAAQCSLAVRFNFLSTDFSHSKGVKGIPVRLCAKTSPIPPAKEKPSADLDSEVCFCKVKLFRDHGAERKLSNDVAHVKKTIEKLKQQISQVESGIKDFGKRKRTTSTAGKLGERPAKVIKHKRTWSISSQGSGGKPAVEDDLHSRLATVQDMFSSTRPVSMLYLRGLEQDDPDAFPVALPKDRDDFGKALPPRSDSWDKQAEQMSPGVSSTGSPTSSRDSKGDTAESKSQVRMVSSDWPQSATLPATNFEAALERERISQQTKVKRISSIAGQSEWIEASGIDPSYLPPPQQLAKPVACIYVLMLSEQEGPATGLYRAVYLMQRTVSALISGIASKSNVDPSWVQRTVRVNSSGLSIFVDDEVVRELPEGQDMTVDFRELESEHPGGLKVEEQDPSTSSTTPTNSGSVEMRLHF